jgi:TonB family protein
MKSSIFLFALAFVTGTSVIAQTPPDLPDGFVRPISLHEAEQHLIEHQPPVYPAIAKAAKVEGTVQLTLEVGRDGTVTGVLQSSGPPLLLKAAADAAVRYRYRPFDVNGAPADVFVEAAVSFSLPVPPHVAFPQISDINSVVMEYDDGWFSVRVTGNGIVEYNGKDRVLIEGKHERRITVEEVQDMLRAFRTADFYSLQYDPFSATDVGSATTSIQIGSQRKEIEHYMIDIPPELEAVQNAILQYSHSDQWTKGNGDTIPALLAEGLSPATRREMLSDILPRAALYSETPVVLDILAQGVNLEHQGPFHDTALMLAADRGMSAMVAALLKAGANAHAVDDYGRSAMIFGAGSGNSEVVRLLLAAGLKGNAKDKYGDTALMAAADAGNPKCVRLLLASGAKVNAHNKRSQTALLSAIGQGTGFYIEDAFRAHAEVPDELVHRDAIVRMLLDAGADINARNYDGETALFSLDDEVVEELLRHHINLEIRDQYGQTALIETVSASIADLLIKAGANVNAQDNDGETALMQAAGDNLIDKVQMLVKAPGIILEQRDNKGETALMKARAGRLPESIQALVSAGATQ